MRSKHTESATVEGQPAEIGRDPRQMSETDLIALGHQKRPLLRVIRANCIECAGNSETEVRRCRMIACPMWPYRMGTNPFQRRELTEDQRSELAERMRVARTRIGATEADELPD
jgi:hypothetical protein